MGVISTRKDDHHTGGGVGEPMCNRQAGSKGEKLEMLISGSVQTPPELGGSGAPVPFAPLHL